MSIIYEPGGRAKEYAWLAVNHYTGCLHGCEYCYQNRMQIQFGNRDFFTRQEPKKDVLKKLLKEAPAYQGTDKRILLCFSCDPYQPLNDKIDLTRKVIEILKQFSIPFQVLTKGGMRAVRDFDLYKETDAFATTLTLPDARLSAQWEPKAAYPAERINAIVRAKDEGIETWVSLEPVLGAEYALDHIRRTYKFVDLYKIGKLNYVKSDTDWRQFAIDAIGLCENYGKPYYIKDDLAKYLDGVSFNNTDTRKVKKKAVNDGEKKRTNHNKNLPRHALKNCRRYGSLHDENRRADQHERLP